METPPKVNETETHDLSVPTSRRKLERQADEILRENGYSVLSPKDEHRKALRRSNIVMRHLSDARLQEIHGASDAVSSARKRSLTDEMQSEAASDLLHKPSTEELLVNSFAPEDYEQALVYLFDSVFNNDKIARIILIDVLENCGGNFRKTKDVSAATGLSAKQINSAKARIRYRLKDLNVASVDDLVDTVKGEMK